MGTRSSAIAHPFLFLLACLSYGRPAPAQLPLQPGEVAATCFGGYSSTSSTIYPNPAGFVVVKVDSADPAGNGANLNLHWPTGMFHNENQGPDEWNQGNLGEVFGVTLDGESPPNIYVTATTVYGDFVDTGGSDVGFGPGGPGAVYRLDGTTGAISTCIVLPNTGAALGNIAHDPLHDQFYVSNLDDGLIYAFDAPSCGSSGWSTFDHGLDGRPNESLPQVADDTGVEFTPFARRVWGLEVYRDRLYYAVWNEDMGCDPLSGGWFSASRGCQDVTQVANEVWSVAIDGAGAFLPATARLEITLPTLDDGPNWGIPDGRVSNPVADIDFGADGRMFLAERGRYRDTGLQNVNGTGSTSDAHRARILEYDLIGSTWTPSSDVYGLGWFNHALGFLGFNSAGGVTSDCEGNVWGTGDALHFGFPANEGTNIYGLQWIRAGGNAPDNDWVENSYLIDLDDDTSFGNHPKNMIGDVVLHDTGCSCLFVENVVAQCAMGGSGDVTVTFDVTNMSGFTAEHVLYTPQGSFTITPPSEDIPSLPDGGTISLSVDIVGAQPGDTICFSVTLLKEDMQACCTGDVCVTLPSCCWDITHTLVCDPSDPTQYLLDVTLVNLTGQDVYSTFLLLPNTITTLESTWVDFSNSPIPPLGSVNLTFTVIGATAGSTECFYFTAHNASMQECCSEKLTLTFPDCEGSRDCCMVTRIVPCCPSTLAGQLTVTICNKSTEARTYDWDIDGLAPSGNCAFQLADTDFSPSAGTTVSVPAGECVDIPVTVDCSGIVAPVAGCALYEVTITSPQTQDVLRCGGEVHFSDTTVKHDPTSSGSTNSGTIDVPIGSTVTLAFDVETQTGGLGPIDLELADLEPYGNYNALTLSLDGLPPGVAQGIQVNPVPGVITPISVDLAFLAGVPEGVVEDVYVRGDLDGDGLDELLSHVSVRAVAGPGPRPGGGTQVPPRGLMTASQKPGMPPMPSDSKGAGVGP